MLWAWQSSSWHKCYFLWHMQGQLWEQLPISRASWNSSPCIRASPAYILLWMSWVGWALNYFYRLYPRHLDTNVPPSSLIPRWFTGRLQYLTTAASIALIQLTKLTQSLRQLSFRMTARASIHKCAENFQAVFEIQYNLSRKNLFFRTWKS